MFGTGINADIGSKRAQERGIRLLMENLSAAQRKQYEKYGYFDVTGGKTGKRYRIRHGRQMNIEQLDRNGRRVCGWCFFPQGSLVSGDVMLAQKAALELFESGRAAHRQPVLIRACAPAAAGVPIPSRQVPSPVCSPAVWHPPG